MLEAQYPYAQEAQAAPGSCDPADVIWWRDGRPQLFEDSLITAVQPAGGGWIPQVWIAGTPEHWDWGPVASRERAWELAAELRDLILKDYQDRDTIETMRESLP